MQALIITILLFPAACIISAAMASSIIYIGRKNANAFYPPWKKGIAYRERLIRNLITKREKAKAKKEIINLSDAPDEWVVDVCQNYFEAIHYGQADDGDYEVYEHLRKEVLKRGLKMPVL